MKTLPLRQLLRDPGKVKTLTKGGEVVRITDGGEPLWDIVAPGGAANELSPEAETQFQEGWEAHFADLLGSDAPSAGMPSLEEVLSQARGDR